MSFYSNVVLGITITVQTLDGFLTPQRKQYSIHVMAIPDTRWQGEAKIDLRTHTLTDWETSGKKVVWGKQIILGFQPNSDRKCILRMETKFRNTTFINIRAPTEEKEEEKRENFYAHLERVCDLAPSNDVKIVLGDKNANIGQERAYYGLTGKHSLHKTSTGNGKLLIGFAQGKNVVMRSTQFPRKDNIKGHLGIPRWTNDEPD